jgi:transcriptional regulator of acetoin/glycerol metabolism
LLRPRLAFADSQKLPVRPGEPEEGGLSTPLIDTRIFSADYKREAADAWKSLVSNGRCPSGAVRSTIKKSWLRCLDSGVSPTLTGAPAPLTSPAKLRGLCSRHQDFLRAASEALSPVYDAIRRSSSMLIVADPDGVLLDCCGEDDVIAFAEDFHIRRGSVWAERTSGTNAIGTALILGQPIQVNATEHFCEGVKRWSCSAAIVRDRVDGSVIGAIDITGMVSEFHLHSLALVISVANHVETILSRQAADRRSTLMQWTHDHVDRSAGQAIVLDRKGRIVSSLDHLAGSPPDRRRHINRLVASARAWLAEVEGAIEPDALDSQWFRPVSVDGQTVGAVIVVPGKTARRAAAAHAPASAGPATGFDRIERRSAAMATLVQRAAKLAMSRARLLIQGETGSGKEELARAIHESSAFRAGPFVPVNCAALAKERIAGELFGYAGGAIAGAGRGGAAGAFERADGGSLLLDEIGALPADMQAQLLPVLQDGRVTRLGAATGRPVNVRIMASSSRDLFGDSRAGRFRSDLYYRISVASLRIPALRDRRDDIPALAERFLGQLGRQYGRPARPVSEEAIEMLRAQDWPGNVRELQNVLERAFLLGDGPAITGADIRCAIGEGELPEPVKPVPAAPLAVQGASLREIEEASIRCVIQQCKGNVLRAARQLGISRSTLYEKIGRYGIKPS